MSHKLLPSLLLVCALFAWPALAQTNAAPDAAASATRNANALTPDQARRALDTLQDDKKRAQMIDTLRAIANAAPSPQAAAPSPEAKPAIPLTADSLGAQLLLTVSEQVGEVSHEIADLARSLRNLKVEVELGYDDKLAAKEVERCLNCDVQTVFARSLCIECDACMDICPVDCINFTDNAEERELRERLRVPAHNAAQDLYVSDVLKTGRIMAKDEDLCLHCGLCAERCPTGAWDMQKFFFVEAQASKACLVHHNAYIG